TKKKGAALLYLLRAYPEERSELFTKHDRDPDNEVQDSLARIEAAEDHHKALARWERAIGTRRLSHEMAEMIPDNIAYAIPREKLHAVIEEYPASRSVWNGGSKRLFPVRRLTWPTADDRSRTSHDRHRLCDRCRRAVHDVLPHDLGGPDFRRRHHPEQNPQAGEHLHA